MAARGQQFISLLLLRMLD